MKWVKRCANFSSTKWHVSIWICSSGGCSWGWLTTPSMTFSCRKTGPRPRSPCRPTWTPASTTSASSPTSTIHSWCSRSSKRRSSTLESNWTSSRSASETNLTRNWSSPTNVNSPSKTHAAWWRTLTSGQVHTCSTTWRRTTRSSIGSTVWRVSSCWAIPTSSISSLHRQKQTSRASTSTSMSAGSTTSCRSAFPKAHSTKMRTGRIR